MARISSYVIASRVPERDEVVLVHGYTGAVDVVSTALYDLIQKAGQGDMSHLSAVPESAQQMLVQRGYITELSVEEERQYTWSMSDALQAIGRARPAFVLAPTYACNFRCPYCFELWMYAKGAEWMNRTMSPEMVDSAFNAMAEINGGRHKPGIPITLYGGEPFQQMTVDIINYIIQKGTALGYLFTAVTNGYHLELFEELMRSGALQGLQITVDGPPALHNARRFKEGGEGTFDRIMENIQLALNCNVGVTMRVNVAQENLSGLSELQDIVDSHGWLENDRFSIYPEIVTGSHGGKLTSAGLLKYIRANMAAHPKLDRLVQGSTMGGRLSGLFTEGGYFQFKGAYCSAHTGMYVFDGHGDIYACWELCGTTEHRIGTYGPEGLHLNEMAARWHSRVIKNVPECSECKYALICGGGCAAHAMEHKGDMFHSFCDGVQGHFIATVKHAYLEWEGVEVKVRAAPLCE